MRRRRGIISAPPPTCPGQLFVIGDDGELVEQDIGQESITPAAQVLQNESEVAQSEDGILGGIAPQFAQDSSMLAALGRYRRIANSYKVIYADPNGKEAHFLLASFKSDGRLDRPYVVGARDVQFSTSRQLRFFCFGGLCGNQDYEETHIFSSRDFPNHTPQECGGVERCLCAQLLLEIYNGDGGLRDIMRGGVSGNVHEVSYKNPGSRTRAAFTGLAVRTEPDPFSYGIVKDVRNGYKCLTCTSNKGSCKHVKIILGRGDLNNPVARKSIRLLMLYA